MRQDDLGARVRAAGLDELIVLYPGERRYALTKQVHVVPLADFVNAR